MLLLDNPAVSAVEASLLGTDLAQPELASHSSGPDAAHRQIRHSSVPDLLSALDELRDSSEWVFTGDSLRELRLQAFE